MPVKLLSTAVTVNSPAYGTDGDFARYFAFNTEELFLPLYQFVDKANKKITRLDT